MDVDPYRLALALLRRSAARGLRAFAHTQVDSYEADDTGVTLRAHGGPSVRASKNIFATGYDTPEFLSRDICALKSTYALVAEPVADLGAWRDRSLIWESGNPYFYARCTLAGRPMIGGEDEEFADPSARDALIPTKAQTLTTKFQSLFPSIHLTPTCAWAGTFAQTKDGLPYIGAARQFPRGYFALGYGGNGIVFGLIAARIIRDLFLGHPNPDATLFRFDR
jgi:glycine/D-amino acid oxidase-like deaminating enzyme